MKFVGAVLGVIPARSSELFMQGVLQVRDDLGPDKALENLYSGLLPGLSATASETLVHRFDEDGSRERRVSD